MAITDWQTPDAPPGTTTGGTMLTQSAQALSRTNSTSQKHEAVAPISDNNFFSFGPGLIGIIVPTELQIWPRGSKL